MFLGSAKRPMSHSTLSNRRCHTSCIAAFVLSATRSSMPVLIASNSSSSNSTRKSPAVGTGRMVTSILNLLRNSFGVG